MNLHTIEQRVQIAASPETVWSFWTDAGRMCEWWGRAAEIVPQPGGRFRVDMGPGGPVMLGEYLELEPHRRLVFSFGWEHIGTGEPMAPGSTRVEVTLTAVDDGTEVRVVHHGLPDDHVGPHRAGWEEFVGRRLPVAAHASGSAAAQPTS